MAGCSSGLIEEYAGRLAGKFKDEVNAIYSDHIRKNARSATKRKGYEDVCSMLRRYEKIAGSANLTDIVTELRDLYRKKSAFMEELDQFN